MRIGHLSSLTPNDVFILARYAAADRPCGRQAYPNSRPLSIRIGACTRCKFAFEHNSMYLLAEPSAFESALQMAAQWDISSVGTLVQYQVYWNKQHGPHTQRQLADTVSTDNIPHVSTTTAIKSFICSLLSSGTRTTGQRQHSILA